MFNNNLYMEIIGWVGTFFIPLGYYLNANKPLEFDEMTTTTHTFFNRRFYTDFLKIYGRKNR